MVLFLCQLLSVLNHTLNPGNCLIELPQLILSPRHSATSWTVLKNQSLQETSFVLLEFRASRHFMDCSEIIKL
ncbi:hypothetical protein NC651_017384 [Populus alba x Populus x berolinensis]|nr:hypothetical protein NC651_017384 [Populus alba x Populus x berolinensis]